MILLFFSIFSFVMWLALLLHPYQPYKFNEILIFSDLEHDIKYPKISVVIPCRNEEKILKKTLTTLASQSYPNYEIIVVDDCSEDASVAEAKQILNSEHQIIMGIPVPDGWAGKMWALHQGIQKASGDWILLSDADITYHVDALKSLMNTAIKKEHQMVSVMVSLSVRSFWEKLLIPSFVYFFKIMYPFKAIANNKSKVAAAAGGCILLKKQVLDEIGGIASIQNELIDDIALAKKIKKTGAAISLWLSPKINSVRPYNQLKDIWSMVTRSAFTELKYSYLRLFFCIFGMMALFIIPLFNIYYGICHENNFIFGFSLAAYVFMSTSYFYCIYFYNLNIFYTLLLPIIAIFYMVMTLDSARNYFLGTKATWKGRNYSKKI